MAVTAVATLQTIWDCKWSRISFVAPGDTPSPAKLWRCVRPGQQHRFVTEDECANCPNWEKTGERWS